jgi:hypothetical protein
MPNPLDVLTKPLQIGVQLAFGLIRNLQQALQGEQPPPEEPKREPAPPPSRRPAKPKPLDDVTITRKVETVLFRIESVDKGKIDVNTADAVVWLRGEAKTPEQIKELEAKALAIPEVKQVENLLHLPKTLAPKRARTKGNAPARKRAPKRTTSERPAAATAGAEPSPKELAEKREGRQPAPLGASEGDADTPA